ncbi:hypothetical protein B7494_g6334 [Chlorociboria aeruginascens]|nr:hypothetical protein B7494_g6334 [Chlorociboria aeruginascens]
MMDEVRITGLEELEGHLQQLLRSPETPLNAELFDEVELQLNEYNIPSLIPRLLPNLTQILAAYQQDPAILVSISIKLLQPIPFTQILSLASEDSLIQALRSPAPSANILGITVIEKASRSPSDTAILSIMKEVVSAFIQTWLTSPQVEVGEKATQAIGDLLQVDCDQKSSGINEKMSGMQLTSRKPPGQGLLWRRVFQDKDIYELIFSLCNPLSPLEERQRSLAQARLLRVLPRLAALNFHIVTHTYFADVEQKYGSQETGLLYFASVEMVNKQDLLMHITLVDFFAELLKMMSMTNFTKNTIDYLAALTKKVTESDELMSGSLESIATSADCSLELPDFLIKLNQY